MYTSARAKRPPLCVEGCAIERTRSRTERREHLITTRLTTPSHAQQPSGRRCYNGDCCVQTALSAPDFSTENTPANNTHGTNAHECQSCYDRPIILLRLGNTVRVDLRSSCVSVNDLCHFVRLDPPTSHSPPRCYSCHPRLPDMWQAQACLLILGDVLSEGALPGSPVRVRRPSCRSS